jgi:two-component system, sensor histidine kinase and response regulator
MDRNSTPTTVRVLLVDDDEEDYLIIKHLFGLMKTITCELEWVSTSDEASRRIADRDHDAYLIDYRIDGQTGLDILHDAGAHERPEPFILLTGIGDYEIERRSLEEAAADFLVKKGLTSDDLAKTLYYALGRKEQEKQKIEQLLELNRSKDEFISIASHQLRTPATTVKQYIAMVLDGMGGDVSDRQRQLLEKAYASNERQLAIVNDLLKVAQIDAGKMELNLSKCNISALATQVIEDFEPFFATENQTLLSVIPENIYATIDENAIRMVMDNLLENAKKYSPKNSRTTMRIYVEENVVNVAVEDEGVGVSNPDKLFKKFSRIENERATEVGGTGLGLYWAQSIARLHEGAIDFEANIPRGSRFVLRLPMQ